MTALPMKTTTPVMRFALVGNPNCGKTSLFNRLTHARAKVANYAGVTVERRSGPLNGLSCPAELIDLPGTYSLHVTSPDEQVARDVILGRMAGESLPDVLVAVVDATNLHLGLQLVLQLVALKRPMVLVLNLMDAANARGIVIDVAGLAHSLGIPVVECVAVQAGGAQALLAELARQAAHPSCALAREPDSTAAETAATSVAEGTAGPDSAERLYARIDQLLAEHVSTPEQAPAWQDALDRWVMHPVIGWGILVAVLVLTFQAVFAWAAPLQDGIDAGMAALGELAGAQLPDGVLKEFIVNGLIAGVGGVLVFLPQILMLFFFILVLEDSGYLPRAAFLLDRPMRAVGLSGRAFIPMLSSFACAVPGIMATRTIQDPHERLIAIMTAPLMTCSARLPVYALIIAAFIPDQTVAGVFNLQGLTLFALYVAGVVSAAAVAWLLRWQRRDGGGREYPLLMELPSYRWPMPYHVLLGLRERAVIFLKRVGGIILALTVLLWFLATYPQAPADAVKPAIEYSFAGQLGMLLLPVFAPLGFTWQMVIALIPAMAAREVAVSALATVYAVASEGDIGGAGAEAMLGTVLGQSWSLPLALAFLAWFVYAPQCLSTIAMVRRETNSALATAGFTAYLFGLAYAASWLTYRVALLVF